MSPRAVLLDALGTLVGLEPPAPRLRAELRREGMRVSGADAERAFGAEIAFYLEHHLEGRDAVTLAELRDRCAEVLGAELALAPARVRGPMLASLRFSAYPDAAPALAELRRRRIALAVVSNWDCSLPSVLAEAGLAERVDAVVSSAAVGVAKPDPAPFRRALELVGAHAGEALHVGDSPEKDVAGARAAGLGAVLLARHGEAPTGSIESLAEVPRLL